MEQYSQIINNVPKCDFIVEISWRYLISQEIVKQASTLAFGVHRGKLPDYMIPQYFVLLDRFELNASGKIDRNKLKEPIINITDNYKGELLNNEKYILINKIINKISNTDILYQPDINLNEIGIDSLKMIQLISELNKNKYNIEVELILECKTELILYP